MNRTEHLLVLMENDEGVNPWLSAKAPPGPSERCSIGNSWEPAGSWIWCAEPRTKPTRTRGHTGRRCRAMTLLQPPAECGSRLRSSLGLMTLIVLLCAACADSDGASTTTASTMPATSSTTTTPATTTGARKRPLRPPLRPPPARFRPPPRLRPPPRSRSMPSDSPAES